MSWQMFPAHFCPVGCAGVGEYGEHIAMHEEVQCVRVCAHMHMSVRVWMCAYACVCLYARVCACMDVCMYVCACMCPYACACMCVHVWMCTGACVCTCVQVCACMRVCVLMFMCQLPWPLLPQGGYYHVNCIPFLILRYELAICGS